MKLNQKSGTSQKHSTTQQSKDSNKGSKQLNNYLKYSGLGFQMLVVIGVAIWGGWKLDDLLSFQFPVFLISFSFIAVFASLYLIIKNLPKG